MPDMLVNLLRLPPLEPLLDALRQHGVTDRRAPPFEHSLTHAFVQLPFAAPRQHGAPIRRAHPFPRPLFPAFVQRHFAATWAAEISAACAHRPFSLFVATRASPAGSTLLGFAAPDCTRRNFFGPMGVLDA